MSPEFQNAIQSAVALDLSDKSRQYVLFVDARAIDVRDLAGTFNATTDFPALGLVIMLVPPPGENIADMVAAQDYGEYKSALIATERERCAKITDETASLLRRGLAAVHPMQQSALETTAELLDSVAAKIRSGE